MQNDTVRLLEECDSGIAMAILAVDGALEAAEDPHLQNTLRLSRDAHRRLQNRTRQLLREHGIPGKRPGPVARGMNRLHTGVRLFLRPGDGTVADLVVTGCNMGVKNLHRFQNRWKAADGNARNVADELIGLEADLANSMFPYL